MPEKVILRLIAGSSLDQEYVFTEPTTVLVGRDRECQVRFPKDRDHQTVSRHHCLLDINPPEVYIRDLGSRNGTLINEELIGQRDKTQSAEEGAQLRFPDFPVQDGNQIKIGNIALQINIVQPARCASCEEEIPEGQETQWRLTDGEYRCALCRTQPPIPETVSFAPRWQECPRCGRDVSDEVGSRQRGQLLCSQCRGEPELLARRLLELAQTSTRDLLSIRGYRIETELGRGGNGAVYLAMNEQTGQRVALKVMLPHLAATRQSRELFLREAENTKILNHRHVVRLFDVGFSEGTFYFTMEYCDGGSLHQMLRKRGQPLQMELALSLVLQVLEGLEYAHQVELPAVPLADGSLAPARGLVHRDIKPENLLLTWDGPQPVVKIGDYGLAKAFDLAGLSGLTMRGQAAGTVHFMPRQQVKEFLKAKPEVDVWATAATLYYLLTRKYPRDFPRGRDPWQVILQTDAVPIRQRDPSIPAKLAEVIDAALIDRPDIQIKSAAALKQALASAV